MLHPYRRSLIAGKVIGAMHAAGSHSGDFLHILLSLRTRLWRMLHTYRRSLIAGKVIGAMHAAGSHSGDREQPTRPTYLPT